MCGIAGFFNIGQADQRQTIKNLEIRGRDGFGFVTGTDNEFVATRVLQTPREYMGKNPEYFEKLTLANTRAVPTTEFQTAAGRALNNQQPFFSERFLWVFNGLIANDKDLIQKHSLKTTAAVDTAMLGPLFEKVGVVEGMRELEGAYAIICYDRQEKKLYFGKNFLPMVMYHRFSEERWEDGSSLIITSLREMLPTYLQSSAIEIPSYTCCEFNIDTNYLLYHTLYRKAPNKRALIIFSSGIDSVVTAWLYKHLGYDLTLLHFTYGQAAEKVEKYAAERLAEKLGAKLLIKDAKAIFSVFKETSKLLRDKDVSSEEQINDAESTMSYVPNRNGIFAMFAAAIAEQEGCDTVAYGGQQNSASYPDNNIDFVKAIDTTLKYCLNWHTNIKFASPFIHLIKHEIVKLGLGLGVPYDLVCSCYYPELKDDKIVVCGTCGCCQFRFSSFKMLGIKDTQEYKSLPTTDWFVGLKDKLEWSDDEMQKFVNQYVREYV